MIKAILLLSLLCSNTSWAGPYVSSGTGPVASYVACRNMSDETVFEIRATSVVSFIQGIYSEPKTRSSVHLKCLGTGDSWKCNEYRSGEGLLSINTQRNSQGFVIAQVFRQNILGEPYHLANLVCSVN